MNANYPQAQTNKRFFCAIRSFFKQEPHGRYFAVLLRELALNEPTSFCALLNLLRNRCVWPGWDHILAEYRHGRIVVKREYEFVRSRDALRGRYAALALLSDG